MEWKYVFAYKMRKIYALIVHCRISSNTKIKGCLKVQNEGNT